MSTYFWGEDKPITINKCCKSRVEARWPSRRRKELLGAYDDATSTDSSSTAHLAPDHPRFDVRPFNNQILACGQPRAHFNTTRDRKSRSLLVSILDNSGRKDPVGDRRHGDPPAKLESSVAAPSKATAAEVGTIGNEGIVGPLARLFSSTRVVAEGFKSVVRSDSQPLECLL